MGTTNSSVVASVAPPSNPVFDPDGNVFLVFTTEDCTEGDAFPATDQTENTTTTNGNTDSNTESNTIRMQVSLVQLVTTSPVFDAMLWRQGFKEAATLKSDNQVEVPLPDDDPEVFRMIMNVIHGHEDSLPDVVKLSVLSGVATAVDKYGWHAAMSVQARKWHKKMGKPSTMTVDEVLERIWISWVFGYPEDFEEMTRYAQKWSTHPLHEGGKNTFGISLAITNAIHRRRVEAISDIHALLLYLIDLYREMPVKRGLGLGPESEGGRLAYRIGRQTLVPTDGLALGLLMIEGTRFGLLPCPPPDFEGISFDDLKEKIKDMVDPDDYGVYVWYWVSGTWSPLNKKIKTTFQELIKRVESEPWGLDLDSFKRNY